MKIGNITDRYVKDFKSLYRVGALVTAKVIGYVDSVPYSLSNYKDNYILQVAIEYFNAFP